MNPERSSIFSKKNFVKATAVFAVSSAGILLAKEALRKNPEKTNKSDDSQFAGDGNYVVTLDEVRKRSGHGF